MGARSIPDPTTAGDFCGRFDGDAVWQLMEAINETRVEVWKKRGASLLGQTARIDADGTLVPTTGECKQGIDIAYNGTWGYHPLVVSLANTGEPLFITNRSGNRPSHEGAKPVFDLAVQLCRNCYRPRRLMWSRPSSAMSIVHVGDVAHQADGHRGVDDIVHVDDGRQDNDAHRPDRRRASC